MYNNKYYYYYYKYVYIYIYNAASRKRLSCIIIIIITIIIFIIMCCLSHYYGRNSIHSIPFILTFQRHTARSEALEHLWYLYNTSASLYIIVNI